MVIVEVPHKEIESTTLKKLVEVFIMREGTDYGEIEVDLDQKISIVINQLKNGDAVSMWDTNLQSSNIVLKKDIDKQPTDTK
jgi:uncharacterized protein